MDRFARSAMDLISQWPFLSLIFPVTSVRNLSSCFSARSP